MDLVMIVYFIGVLLGAVAGFSAGVLYFIYK